MAYYADDCTSSDSEDEVELCEQELFTGPKLGNKSGKKQYDDMNEWDYRVAREICRIHREAFSRQNNQKFSNWVNDNLDHLENLYQLSGMKIPEETFYTFVYDQCH